MIVYKDILTGDELFSDSYQIATIDDCYYEVEGKLITEKDKDYSSMIGANPSAEGGGDDDCDPSEKTDINIVIAHKLQATAFTKKQYIVYIKDYMKSIIAKIEESDPEKVPTLKPRFEKKVKDIVSNFSSYEFYTGESMNPDGCILLLNYREDGRTPFFTVFKDAVESEKY